MSNFDHESSIGITSQAYFESDPLGEVSSVDAAKLTLYPASYQQGRVRVLPNELGYFDRSTMNQKSLLRVDIRLDESHPKAGLIRGHVSERFEDAIGPDWTFLGRSEGSYCIEGKKGGGIQQLRANIGTLVDKVVEEYGS